MNKTFLNKQINMDKLNRPTGKIHFVLDTDAFNEIDDQYALAYALKKTDRLTIEAIYAAPFYNDLSDSPADGMEKSYNEIKKIIKLMHREDLQSQVYRGSTNYLVDASTPQKSEAALDLVKRAMNMPEGEILYIAAIGAITNIASALLLEPKIKDKIVVVWLGGHAHYWSHTKEFNLFQDVNAANIVFTSGVPLVQVPCLNVASHLLVTEPELAKQMAGKSEIGDYLYRITCKIAARQERKYWSRVIWDISTLMWLIGPSDCLTDYVTESPTVTPDGHYVFNKNSHRIKVVEWINRDIVFEEFFETLKKG